MLCSRPCCLSPPQGPGVVLQLLQTQCNAPYLGRGLVLALRGSSPTSDVTPHGVGLYGEWGVFHTGVDQGTIRRHIALCVGRAPRPWPQLACTGRPYSLFPFSVFCFLGLWRHLVLRLPLLPLSLVFFPVPLCPSSSSLPGPPCLLPLLSFLLACLLYRVTSYVAGLISI